MKIKNLKTEISDIKNVLIEIDKVNWNFSNLSGTQLQLFKGLDATQLQTYITQLQAIKAASNGIFNETAILKYSYAIQGLEAKQAALLLSTQGLTNAQIAETLAVNESNVATNYQAMADAGLLASKQKLTVAQIQENLQTVLGAEADTSAAMASLGLSKSTEVQANKTVKLTAKKLQEAVATNALTEAQAQELAMRTGVTLSMNAQTASTLPKWIAMIQAGTKAIWSQVKATAVWLASTPAGWATAAIAAIGGVIAGLNKYAKATKEASDKAQEAFDKSKERVKSNKEEAKSLDELIQKYKELKSSSDIDSGTRDEIKELQYDIVDLVGAEAKNLDLVNGKLDDQLQKLKEISAIKSKQNVEDARDNYYKATYASDKMVGDADKYGNDVAVKWLDEASRIHKVNGFETIDYDNFISFITGSGGFDDIFRKNNDYNIFNMKFVVDTKDIDGLDAKIARLKELKDFLAENRLTNTELYQDVVSAIEKYQSQYNSEIEAVNNLVDIVVSDLSVSNDKLKKITVDSLESFEEYRNKMIDTVKSDEDIAEILSDGILSDDDIEKVVNNFMATAEGFSTWYEKWIGGIKGNIEKASFSDIFSLKSADDTLTTLGKISESIDTIQNAYKTLYEAIKEYNEEGAISIDTLQSVIALGDDWLDYLVDEEGNLKLDKESLEELTQARLNDMRIQSINNVIDNVSKIKTDADATEYLTTTNYALAESYEEVAQKALESARAQMQLAVNEGTLSQLNMDAAMNKATADIDKINKLFANTSIDVDSMIGSFGKSSSSSSKKSEFSETIDYFKQRVEVLDNALSHLDATMDNVSGSFGKNNLVDAKLGINEEKFRNYTDAISMYTQKANEALSKLPADIAAKVKDGAVAITDFIGDGNKDVVEAIKDYENWADEISECKQELAELQKEIRQLELQKFNNIMSDFEFQFNLRGDSKDLISKQIALLKEAGELIGESFFTAQIDQSKKQLELLEKEKAQLVNQMSSAINSGRVNCCPLLQ